MECGNVGNVAMMECGNVWGCDGGIVMFVGVKKMMEV